MAENPGKVSGAAAPAPFGFEGPLAQPEQVNGILGGLSGYPLPLAPCMPHRPLGTKLYVDHVYFTLQKNRRGYLQTAEGTLHCGRCWTVGKWGIPDGTFCSWRWKTAHKFDWNSIPPIVDSVQPAVGKRPSFLHCLPSRKSPQTSVSHAKGDGFTDASAKATDQLPKEQRSKNHPKHARHSTMLYSMQVGTLSPNRADGLMKHGRASREAT